MGRTDGLDNTWLIDALPPMGFGAFKIGRNQGIKYPSGYELPDDDEVSRLLNGVLDLGINYIDTAPAYGLSEQRIGAALAARQDEFIVSTKVGERFQDGVSTYAFDRDSVCASLDESRRLLKRSTLDLVYVHSNGNDLEILNDTDVVETLCAARDRGDVRSIGFSGKTIEGTRSALAWTDAIMVEYHMDDASMEPVMRDAEQAGIAVVVKKALHSGSLPAADAIAFVLQCASVTSVVVGGLNLDHIRSNLAAARTARPS